MLSHILCTHTKNSQTVAKNVPSNPNTEFESSFYVWGCCGDVEVSPRGNLPAVLPSSSAEVWFSASDANNDYPFLLTVKVEKASL
jgi:hypothetical protein